MSLSRSPTTTGVRAGPPQCPALVDGTSAGCRLPAAPTSPGIARRPSLNATAASRTDPARCSYVPEADPACSPSTRCSSASSYPAPAAPPIPAGSVPPAPRCGCRMSSPCTFGCSALQRPPQRRARMPLPGPAQPLQTRPQAPVGQVRTPELAPDASSAPSPAAATSPPNPIPDPAATPPSARPAPQTPAADPPLPRTPNPPHGSWSPDATPPARLHQHRPNPVPRRPVRRQTTHRTPQHVRRQVRYPNRRQQESGHLPDVQPPRAVVPTVRVARTQPQRRRRSSEPPTRQTASNRYVRRQPDRPSGWHASRRRPHNRRSAGVRAHRLRPTPPGCR